MIAPALLFLALNRSADTRVGWGVPMATDLAFAVGILLLLGKRVPAPLPVLLLPFAIEVLGAGEFEYGIQEAVTSVGFVIGSLLMARYADRLREGTWLVLSFLGMGLAGLETVADNHGALDGR